MFVLTEKVMNGTFTLNTEVTLVNTHDFPTAIQKVKDLVNNNENLKRDSTEVEFHESAPNCFGFTLTNPTNRKFVVLGHMTNEIAKII